MSYDRRKECACKVQAGNERINTEKIMNHYILYVLGFLLSLSQPIQAQTIYHIEENTIIDEIPFELTDHNNMSVRAILNKKDSVNLMFHTAASSITLIEESTEKLSGISWNREYDVKSWGGESSARYSESNFLEIGNLEWDSISIWENKNSGPKTDGKFGPNLFEGMVIEMDFDNSLLVIHSALPSKIDEFEKLSLIYENEFMFIEGVSIVDGVPYENRFLIHSGYGGAILYDDEFVETSSIGAKLKVVDESELKDSYGNVLKTKKAILPIFRIGGTIFKNIPVGFFEGAIGKQKMSVVGGNVLKRFNLIIDADRKNIYIKENELMGLAFSENSN